MKKLKTILFLCMGILALTACSSSEEDTDAEYYNWQSRNATFFNDIYDNAVNEINNNSKDWVVIKSASKNNEDLKTNYIVVRILSQEKGTHSEKDEKTGAPNKEYQLTASSNDACTVTYRGNLMPSKSYDKVVAPDNARVGKEFETKWYGADLDLTTATFADFTPNQTIKGFSTVLQYMHPGDRWRVYIPQQLGYQSKTSTAIPAYSTLIYDIYLKQFTTSQKR